VTLAELLPLGGGFFATGAILGWAFTEILKNCEIDRLRTENFAKGRLIRVLYGPFPEKKS
jgi:hypothetical protein